MFSLRRKHSMKKWRSDTPHKLQMGGDPNLAAAQSAVTGIESMDDGSNTSGPAPLEGAVNMASSAAKSIMKTGGTVPGKFLKQGGATGRKLL